MTGVSVDITDAELLAQLQEDGLEAERCLRIKSRATDKATTLVRVFVKTQESAEKAVRDGINLGWIHHRCEESHSPPAPRVTQCFRCLRTGHVVANCPEADKAPRCNRCGDRNHLAKDCTRDKDSPMCANCGETHSARYRGCRLIKEAQAEANQAAAANKPSYAQTTRLPPAAAQVSSRLGRLEDPQSSCDTFRRLHSCSSFTTKEAKLP